MADVKVKIKLQDTVEDTIEKIRVDNAQNVTKLDEEYVNNVSIFHPPKLDMSMSTNVDFSKFGRLSTKNNGVNLKSWATGKLSLADGYVGGSNTSLGSWRGYNGYVFGAVPENKKFELTLAFFGQNIDSIIIYGDKNANQFPTKAYLDSNSTDFIYSDDLVWAIRFDNPSKTHTITFLEWNRGNYNACITYVAVLKNELELDTPYLKNIEVLSQINSQPQEVYFGVVPNSATIEVLDRDGELYDYVRDGIIENSNLKVDVLIGSNKVQECLTIDTDYDINQSLLTFETTNSLSDWDKIQFYGLKYENARKTLLEILYIVLSKIGYTTNEVDNMLTDKIYFSNISTGNRQYGNIKDYLSSIVVEVPYMESSTIREAIDKICEVAQLNVYQNDNGEIKFTSSRPIKNQNEIDFIVLPAKAQTKQFSDTLINKNKINCVKINQSSFNFEDSQFGDTETITFYNYENGVWADYTNALPVKYSAKKYTVGGTDKNGNYNGDERIYMEITTEFNADEIYATNMQVQFRPSYFRYRLNEATYLESVDSDGVITFSLPEPSSKPSSFVPSFPDNKKPAVYTEYNDNRTKIIVHFAIWVQGAIGKVVDSSAMTREYLRLGNVSISLVGRILKHTTQEMSYGNGSLIYEMTSSNTLLQGNSLCQMIVDNLLSDYVNGIATAKTTIACMNLYDENKDLVVDWNSNQIIQLNSIVRVDKDNLGNPLTKYKDGTTKLWKVTGRTFRKQGVPLIDLELQEIKQ